MFSLFRGGGCLMLKMIYQAKIICHADSPEMSYEDIKKSSKNVDGIIYEVS